MKIFNKLMMLFALVVATTGASTAAVITVSSDITSNTSWTNSNTYVLQGYRFVKNGATLTIQAGTVIKGDKSTKGTLIIARGAKIDAQGTKTQPIVFTSNQSVGSRAAGDWGGIIILGKAPINQPGDTAIIEGGVNNSSNDAVYGGGATPNSNDNSGIMKYVRIEFPGIAFALNNEINGLTMGGVGAGTKISYIQVSYSGDDAFEWFGGTVKCDHLISFKPVDDNFDTDNGFSGKVQFGVSLVDPNIADISGSNGFESDNNATGSASKPTTKAVFSNMTIVGPLKTSSTSINSNFKRSAHMRRNTECSIYNSVLMGYPVGLLVDGSLTEVNADSGLLDFNNNFISGMTNNLSVAAGSSWNISSFFSSNSNTTYTANTSIGLVDAFNLTAPDFRPNSSSPLLGAADFSSSRLAGLSSVTYAGAFSGTGDTWADCWTEFDLNNTSNSRVTYTSSTPLNYNINVTISGNSTGCKGDSVTLTGTSGFAAYQWLSGTSAIAGANSSTLKVGKTGTYSLMVWNGRGCSGISASKTVTINNLPKASLTSNTGYFKYCTGGNITLTCVPSVAGSYSYQWEKDSVTISGQTSSTLVVSTDGNYRCYVTDNATSCHNYSSQKKCASTYAKTPTLYYTCNGGSYTLTAKLYIGYTYTWYRGATNLGTTSSNVYSTSTAGTYTVVAHSLEGCTSSASIALTIPAATTQLKYTSRNKYYGLVGDMIYDSTITGAYKIQVMIVDNSNSSNVSYAYANTSSGAIVLSTALPTLSYGKTYSVASRILTTNKDTGCWGTSYQIMTVSQAAPPATKLSSTWCGATSVGATTITCNAVQAAELYTFKFYDGNTLIKTFTSTTNSIVLSGLSLSTLYHVPVSVKRDGITTNPTDTCNITTTSLAPLGPVSQSNFAGNIQTIVKLYPVPVSTVCNMEITTLESQIATIKVMDVTGKIVNTPIITSLYSGTNNLNLDFSNLTQGLYIIQVSTNNGILHTERFSIQR